MLRGKSFVSEKNLKKKTLGLFQSLWFTSNIAITLFAAAGVTCGGR